MSGRRFEVVHTDAAQPFFVREIASNGKQTFKTSENYASNQGAHAALVSHIRCLHPVIRVWFSTGTGGPELRVGMPEDTYATAHRIEVRTVDERTTR